MPTNPSAYDEDEHIKGDEELRWAVSRLWAAGCDLKTIAKSVAEAVEMSTGCLTDVQCEITDA